jgi:Flp pilus assembly protein CpaB
MQDVVVMLLILALFGVLAVLAWVCESVQTK